ncbi:hypothetical protein MM326_15025 [Alkalihalobacillus sp. LMS6]|uniref:hypothetical protein n=1 Tax=Alkalihalobacillus sp. LMS6 TaxID=2924034 RepID=UPI0020CFEB8A|nr:hypothetical protein [Alkalihalobacillus sp. LMS6]UTR05409.1 hypothetical protein MM326_15025 [Alkalihalobacillus sp. LMS6]
MDAIELMKLERKKAVINAIAQLDIALSTFYDEGGYDRLDNLRDELKDYAEIHL